MYSKQDVIDTLVAINSVRRRLKVAVDKGQNAQAYILMGDLISLSQCLEGAATRLIDDIDSGALEALLKDATDADLAA